MRDSQRCAMAEGTLVANLVCDYCVFLAFFGTLRKVQSIPSIRGRVGQKTTRSSLVGCAEPGLRAVVRNNVPMSNVFCSYYGRYYLRPCSISSPMLPVTYLNSALLPAAAA